MIFIVMKITFHYIIVIIILVEDIKNCYGKGYRGHGKSKIWAVFKVHYELHCEMKMRSKFVYVHAWNIYILVGLGI